MRDVSFCLRKAAEYRAKARKENHRNLKSAFEAAAREYDSRAKENTTRISEENAVLYFRSSVISKTRRTSPK